MPAALILLVGGLCSCFAGYRIFRWVLAFFGFVFGALFVGAAMGSEQTLWMIAAWLVGGLIGAVILFAAYFVGVALIGAGIGAGLAMVLWAAVNREPGIWPVIILAVLGAVGALAVQRHVIIVATAFAGAQTAVVGAAELVGGRNLAAAGRQMVHVYPLDPLPNTRLDLIAFIVLGLVGLVIQLRTSTGKKSK
ncbi:MAG TPA: DUF4203 domain-containing protein [Vicinamibacterales bacterium]|nr:DUF4203 domain-containing protein [Vicinamibacterales bacterium]